MAKQKNVVTSLSKTLFKTSRFLGQRDIQDWRNAVQAATNVYTPFQNQLIDLYENIVDDNVLFSQLQNRMLAILGAEIELVLQTTGEVNEEATKILTNAEWREPFMRYILEAVFYRHSLVQVLPDDDGDIRVELVKRQHIEPVNGLVLVRQTDRDGVAYRDLPEYGQTLFEFGDPTELGLLNKAVPLILMKKIAIALFSEYTQLFGVPPRVAKTNTSDADMVRKLGDMLENMGSANWSVIDKEEDFVILDAVVSNGDVFDNFIRVVNQEVSMLMSGAVIGQDTANGNYSKEKSNQDLLQKIIDADKRKLLSQWNGTVQPALEALGLFPAGLNLRFKSVEDLETLWTRTKDALPYFDISPDWLKQKFGIEATAKQPNF
jgi:phage gp29-like protein